MDRMFDVIEKTMNKSAIDQFRKFMDNYSDVSKWIMCSDYCLDDSKKKNDVVSFVIYPYILNMEDWNGVIESLQKKDLKHSRNVSDEFCSFLKAGYFFSFNYVLEKDCILEKWQDSTSLNRLLDTYIQMMESWQESTPNNKDIYKEMCKKFKLLKKETMKKSFNYKLFGRVIEIVFLASYLKYLLCRESKKIELFSWLSDRDAITNWNNGICSAFYHVCSHCLISSILSQERDNEITDIQLRNPNENFYDSMNRVADFVCGAIADFDYANGSVSGKKQCVLMEDAIADNEWLIVFDIHKAGVARISHMGEIEE